VFSRPGKARTIRRERPGPVSRWHSSDRFYRTSSIAGRSGPWRRSSPSISFCSLGSALGPSRFFLQAVWSLPSKSKFVVSKSRWYHWLMSVIAHRKQGLGHALSGLKKSEVGHEANARRPRKSPPRQNRKKEGRKAGGRGRKGIPFEKGAGPRVQLAFKRLAQFGTQGPQVRGYRVSGDDCALASMGSAALGVYAPLMGEASTRVGLVPFFQIGRRPIRALLLLGRSLPWLVGLLGVFPIGLLARIAVWFSLLMAAPSRGNPKCRMPLPSLRILHPFRFSAGDMLR
jgi:hypothetical protein